MIEIYFQELLEDINGSWICTIVGNESLDVYSFLVVFYYTTLSLLLFHYYINPLPPWSKTFMEKSIS